MKRTLILCSLLATSALAYERLQGPTELLFCNKEKALPGYTLFGVGNRTFLLDLDGRVVHKWPVGTNPHLLAPPSAPTATPWIIPRSRAAN